MTDTQLLEYSETQKLTATKILEDSNLISLLSKYGKCSIAGSYAYDLMCGSDIDLIIETDNPREASLQAVKELLDARQFQKYQYGDFEKFPRVNRPKSFIVVLISDIEGVKWETEIWFEKHLPQNIIEIDSLIKERLTPESRLAILRLKHERNDRGNDKHQLSSSHIYKAVLIDGLTDYDQILAKYEN